MSGGPIGSGIAPGCEGPIYGCADCDVSGLWITELEAHKRVCTGVSTRCRKLCSYRPRMRKALCALPVGHDGPCDPIIRDRAEIERLKDWDMRNAR